MLRLTFAALALTVVIAGCDAVDSTKTTARASLQYTPSVTHTETETIYEIADVPQNVDVYFDIVPSAVMRGRKTFELASVYSASNNGPEIERIRYSQKWDAVDTVYAFAATWPLSEGEKVTACAYKRGGGDVERFEIAVCTEVALDPNASESVRIGATADAGRSYHTDQYGKRVLMDFGAHSGSTTTYFLTGPNGQTTAYPGVTHIGITFPVKTSGGGTSPDLLRIHVPLNNQVSFFDSP